MTTFPVRGKRGFTILELVVALTMVVVMLAVIVPSVKTRLDQAQASSLQTTLDGVLLGIRNYKTNVARYPQRLQQLSYIPTTNRPFDICGNNILGSASKWRGPYVSVQIDTTSPTDPASPRGLPIGDYVANDLLVRSPTYSSTPGRVEVQVPDVIKDDYTNLNLLVDGQSVPPLTANGSDTAGTVRWTSTSQLLGYGVVVNGC